MDYYHAFEGKFIFSQHGFKRRAQEINAQIFGSHTMEEWKAKLEGSKGYCTICEKYYGIDNLEKDHIIPLTHPNGCSDAIENIQPLCKSCNCSKGGFKYL